MASTSRHDEIDARIEREMICIVAGHVLDPATAVALYDRYGEVLICVLSPEGWEQVEARIKTLVPGVVVVTRQAQAV